MFFLFFVIGAKKTFGRNTNGRGFFYDRAIEEKEPFQKHDAQTMLDVAALLGADGHIEDTEIWSHSEDSSKIERFLLDHHIGRHDTLISLHPGARRKTHRWPLNRYAQLADCLFEKYNAKVIITAGRSEKGLIKEMRALMKNPVILMPAEWSLSDFICLLDRCQLFITNDTGPMHVANCLGVPLVVISGNTPYAFLPVKKGNIVILRKPVLNADNRAALHLISCDDVLRAAEELMVKI